MRRSWKIDWWRVAALAFVAFSWALWIYICRLAAHLEPLAILQAVLRAFVFGCIIIAILLVVFSTADMMKKDKPDGRTDRG